LPAAPCSRPAGFALAAPPPPPPLLLLLLLRAPGLPWGCWAAATLPLLGREPASPGTSAGLPLARLGELRAVPLPLLPPVLRGRPRMAAARGLVLPQP
jgi:hypothetical protein